MFPRKYHVKVEIFKFLEFLVGESGIKQIPIFVYIILIFSYVPLLVKFYHQ